MFSCLFAKYQIVASRSMLSGDEWKLGKSSWRDCVEGLLFLGGFCLGQF